MSFVLKAQHASDSSTPKISHTVSDIAVKTRETRSDKPETFYHLSPTKKTDEETFSLGDELGAEFASKLNLDEPELKSYTLQHDDDDDPAITLEKAKKLAAEFEALTELGKTASTIALGGDKPQNYSFFATPIASDASADAPFSLSASGESKTLDVAASDLPTVAGKTVDSVESTAVDASDTAASSAESDVHDLGATSVPYFSSDPSGLADTASVTETDDPGDTGKSAAESALLHTEEVETLDLGATGGTAVDTGLDVESSDAESEDTGESVASEPSIATTSADVAPPTATVDSTAGTAPTAPTPSVSSVPAPVVVAGSSSGAAAHPVVDSDSDSESEMPNHSRVLSSRPNLFRG